MPFRNRSEAGRRLAVALAGYKEQEPTNRTDQEDIRFR